MSWREKWRKHGSDMLEGFSDGLAAAIEYAAPVVKWIFILIFAVFAMLLIFWLLVQPLTWEDEERVEPDYYISRYVDEEFGVACYVYSRQRISCVQVKKGATP